MHFIDLTAQRLRLEDKINTAVLNVVADGRYILGPQVKEFEEKLAQYIGVKHVIACANGTDALLMPLMAKNIGKGDAVFCPSFTFAATAEVIALVGAEPVFIDVLPESFNINVSQLKQAIYDIKKEGRLKPKAIIPVDLFGLAADYNQICAIAMQEDLFVIEDAAQAIGGRYNNQMCGAFGNVGSTSFYPAKPLGCYGDGGAMFTNDDDLAMTLRSILFHGKGSSQYDNVRIGLNSRLDTIQAAILLEKLAILEDEMIARTRIADYYHQGLKDVVKTPLIPANSRSAFAQYTIIADKRDELQEHLKQQNIPSVIYYLKPLHLQTAYKDFAQAAPNLMISESLGSKVLSLPMHPYLTQDDQDIIIEQICQFYRH